MYCMKYSKVYHIEKSLTKFGYSCLYAKLQIVDEILNLPTLKSHTPKLKLICIFFPLIHHCNFYLIVTINLRYVVFQTMQTQL